MWDVSAGDKHTLLLADGDCIQPIIYYSGQQLAFEVKEEEQQEADGCAQEAKKKQEEKLKTGRRGAVREGSEGGYTQQPVLLPFCMNVSIRSSRFTPAWRKVVQPLYFTSLFLRFFLLLFADAFCQQCVCGRWPVCSPV